MEATKEVKKVRVCLYNEKHPEGSIFTDKIEIEKALMKGWVEAPHDIGKTKQELSAIAKSRNEQKAKTLNKVDDLLVEARTQASDIVEKAKTEAEIILEDAQILAEQNSMDILENAKANVEKIVEETNDEAEKIIKDAVKDSVSRANDIIKKATADADKIKKGSKR